MAVAAFDGDQGLAAVSKDGGTYQTVFFGFPFEAIPTDVDRQAVLDAVFGSCGADVGIFGDGFESGDTSAWSLTNP